MLAPARLRCPSCNAVLQVQPTARQRIGGTVTVLLFIALLIWAKLTATPSLIFWPLAAIAIVTMAVCSTLGDLVPKKEVTLASIVNELRSFKPSWALIAAVGVSVMLLAGAAYFSSK